MKRYPIRVLKSLIMFFVMIIIVFLLVYFLSSVKQEMGFWEFVQKNDWKSMIMFLAVFSLVYPFVGFITKKIYTNRPLSEADKQMIIDLFHSVNYELAKDENHILTFKHKTTYIRFMRLIFEDSITINYGDNPLVMEGLRRDAYRLSRAIEYKIRQEPEHGNTQNE